MDKGERGLIQFVCICRKTFPPLERSPWRWTLFRAVPKIQTSQAEHSKPSSETKTEQGLHSLPTLLICLQGLGARKGVEAKGILP